MGLNFANLSKLSKKGNQRMETAQLGFWTAWVIFPSDIQTNLGCFLALITYSYEEHVEFVWQNTGQAPRISGLKLFQT